MIDSGSKKAPDAKKEMPKKQKTNVISLFDENEDEGDDDDDIFAGLSKVKPTATYAVVFSTAFFYFIFTFHILTTFSPPNTTNLMTMTFLLLKLNQLVACFYASRFL